MGISGMNASIKANSIRGRKPGFIKSSDAKRVKSSSLRKRRAKPEQLEKVKNKIQNQNRVENCIYLVIVIGFVMGAFYYF